MANERNRGGRPRAANPADLTERVLTVLELEGYTSATMVRIAARVGVSTRTVHRYFSSKAEMVWPRLSGSVEVLTRRLEAASHQASPLDAVSAAVVAALGDLAEPIEITRRRLRIIAATPELNSASADAFRAWREPIVAHLADRMGCPKDDLRVLEVTAAVQSVTMTALVWWAQHDLSTRPEAGVDESLRRLAAGFQTS
jgi:AcrR family transcriptional regulator